MEYIFKVFSHEIGRNDPRGSLLRKIAVPQGFLISCPPLPYFSATCIWKSFATRAHTWPTINSAHFSQMSEIYHLSGCLIVSFGLFDFLSKLGIARSIIPAFESWRNYAFTEIQRVERTTRLKKKITTRIRSLWFYDSLHRTGSSEFRVNLSRCVFTAISIILCVYHRYC